MRRLKGSLNGREILMNAHAYDDMSKRKPPDPDRGPPTPVVYPLLPALAPGLPLALIDIDCDKRGDGKHTGTEMVFDTTRRMRLARGTALLGEQGEYREIPPPPRPTRLVSALLAIASGLRLYRPKRVQTDWGLFFDPKLLAYDRLVELADERIDALERAGWSIIFVTSLPDTCFEARRQQMIEAGLLTGEARGLVCKPACAQFLKTKHWKALVVAGVRTHHCLGLSDREYRQLPDLLEAFPWMLRGLLEYYRTGQVLFVNDEAENRRQVANALGWFPAGEVDSSVFSELSQLDTFLLRGVAEPGEER